MFNDLLCDCMKMFPWLVCLFICYQTIFTFVHSQTREIFWNSSTDTWLEFHVNFCGRVCRDDTLQRLHNDRMCGVDCIDVTINMLHANEICESFNCFPCDCDRSCHIYDTCCPTWTDGILTAPVRLVSDILPHSDRFQCHRLTSDPQLNSYYTISDCDPNFASSSLTEDAMNSDASDVIKAARDITIQQCKDPDTKTLDDVTPYLDLHYAIVYKNKFCAICNGYKIVEEENNINQNVSDHKKVASAWSLEVSCDHYQDIFGVTTELEFFKAASKRLQNGCQVKFKPPKSKFTPRDCDVTFQESVEPTCTSRDTILNEHCFNLSNRFLRLKTSRNIFCYMCGGQRIFQSCPSVFLLNRHSAQGISDFDTRAPYVPPISLLVGLDRHHQLHAQQSHNCSPESLWVKEVCKAADCSSGKRVTTNGTCASVIKQIRGLGYKMAVKLVTSDTTLVTRQHVECIHGDIFKRLRTLSNDLELKTVTKVDCGTGRRNETTILHDVLIETFLIGDRDTVRDDFELRLIKLAQNFWEFNLSPATSSELNVTLIPFLLGMELVNQSTHNTSKIASKASFMCPKHTMSLYRREEQESERVNSSNTKVCTYVCEQEGLKFHKSVWWFEQEGRKFHESLWSLKKDFTDVTYSLTCPYVVVKQTKLSIEDHSASVSFEHEGRTVERTSLQNISLVNDQLIICIDVDVFKMATRVTQSTDIVILILYYFQVVCVSVSIVCLILSAVTFCLFPSLRSLPGLNNMSLCLSLAIAQTCLLITVQYGVHGVLPPIYCLLHAIVLHYSWLASFLWMSACCIHMFRVFTCHGNQFINTRSDKQRHLKYCLYAYGVPLLIVAFTLAINAALTSGATLGYDDTICFLDTRRSSMNIALSLLLPLCCMVLSNGVLFALTVRRIIIVSKVSESAKERGGQGVMTYVKLSTLTGVFCIVAAVSVWLNNIPLQFVTSPLMALQGVFIFFSFIINSRVGKLYSDIFSGKNSLDGPSSSDRKASSLSNRRTRLDLQQKSTRI